MRNDELKNRLLNTISIVRLAESLGVSVKKDKTALCLFHNDKTPSMHLYESNTNKAAHFHCYACGAHGDIFSLVMKVNNLSFIEAFNFLCDYEGLSGELKSKYNRTFHQTQSAFQLAYSIYKREHEDNILSEWASQRKIDIKILNYADILTVSLNTISRQINTINRFDWEKLADAGIIYKNQLDPDRYLSKNSGYLNLGFLPVDAFNYQGLLFSVRNKLGEVNGFACRSNDENYKGPKYKYTKGFKKSENFYRVEKIYKLLKNLEPSEKNVNFFDLFITEGFMDALRLESIGFNAISILGSSLSGNFGDKNSQPLILNDLANDLPNGYTLRLHLFLDNDEPGRKGTEKSILTLIKLSALNPNFLFDCISPISELKDPDEILKNKDSNYFEKKIIEWSCPPIILMASNILGIHFSDFNNKWDNLDHIRRVLLINKLTKYFVKGTSLDFQILMVSSYKDFIYNSLEKNESFSLLFLQYFSKKVTKAKERTTKTPFNSIEFKFDIENALKIAEKSYTTANDFPYDLGSWSRLKSGINILIDDFRKIISNISKPIEPYASNLTPRDSGGKPRLKVQPCIEDLVIETYILQKLIIFGIENPGTIPLTLHDSEDKKTTTYAEKNILALENETVTFAYQFNIDSVAKGQPFSKGLFRHFSECWDEYNGYILKKLKCMPKKIKYLHSARLDIHRYYDCIPRSVLLSHVDSFLELAFKQTTTIIPPFESDKGDQERNNIRNWIAARCFGYEFYSPSKLENEIFLTSDRNYGIPQGPNLSSWLANTLLFEMDKYIIEECEKINNAYRKQYQLKPNDQVAIYARYVDDIIIIAPEENNIKKLRECAIKKLEELKLELSPKTEPEPRRNIIGIKKWIVKNRGVASASGGWDDLVQTNEFKFEFPLLIDTLDRKEALAVLHSGEILSSSLHNSNSIRQHLRNTIKFSNDIRYKDYRKIAQLSWHLLCDEKDKFSIQEMAKKYWKIWEELTGKTISSINDDKKLLNYENAVNSLWPLLVTFEGFQQILVTRFDTFSSINNKSKGILSKNREGLIKLIYDKNFLNEIQDALGDSFKVHLSNLKILVESKKLSLMSFAGIELKRPLNDVASFDDVGFSKHSYLFRFLLSVNYEESEKIRPYPPHFSSPDSLNRILLFHDVLHRLRFQKDNDFTEKTIEITAENTDQDKLLGCLALLLPHSKDINASFKKFVFESLTLYSRIANYDNKTNHLPRLKERPLLIHALLPSQKNESLYLLPAPEDLPLRLIICVLLDKNKKILKKYCITEKENMENIFEIVYNPKIESDTNDYFSSLSFPKAFADEKLAIHRSISEDDYLAKFGFLKNCFNSFRKLTDRESLVNTSWHIVSNTDNTKFMFLTWKEDLKLLEGKVFKKDGIYAKIKSDIAPYKYDWIWRLGYAITGVLNLEHELSYDIESKLLKTTRDNDENWIYYNFLLYTLQVLRGKFWWSKPSPKKKRDKVSIPRIVEDALNRTEEILQIQNLENIESKCKVLDLSLGARIDSKLMALIKRYNENINKPGIGSMVLFELAPIVISSNGNFIDIVKKLAKRIKIDSPQLQRKDVNTWHKISSIFHSIADHYLSGQNSNLKTIGSLLKHYSLILYLREIVLELWQVIDVDNLVSHVSFFISDFPETPQDTILYSNQSLNIKADDSENFIEHIKIVLSTSIDNYNDLKNVTPFGWFFLFYIIAVKERGGWDINQINNELLKYSNTFSFSVSLSQDYPWGLFMDLIYKIETTDVSIIKIIEEKNNIQVKANCKGDYPLKHRKFTTENGSTFKLKRYQIAYSNAFGEERGSIEESTISGNDTPLYCWSESWLSNKLLGISMVSPIIAELRKIHGNLGDLETKTIKKENKTITQSSIARLSMDEKKKPLQTDQENNENENSNKVFNMSYSLNKIRKIQDESWTKRQDKNGNHKRVALFQYRGPDSYCHPIKEICYSQKCHDEKIELWQKSKNRESYVEFRRRKLLAEVVRACDKFKVDILVLPEYSVRPETVEWLIDELKNIGNDDLLIWAGTYKNPDKIDTNFYKTPNLNLNAYEAALNLISSDGVLNQRSKKYPSVAVNESFKPYKGEIKCLYNSPPDSKQKIMPGEFCSELICAEIFMATSPANMGSITENYSELFKFYNKGRVDADFERYTIDTVSKDLSAFSENTGFKNFPRRTILLIPAMTERSVDFHILGQANYFAANMCTVFCNGVIGGKSCFIGYGCYYKDQTEGPWYELNELYCGITPGIYKRGSFLDGALGKKEQALIIADIDPVYMNEGKPRQQSLPKPLKLVAHLPVIEKGTNGSLNCKKDESRACEFKRNICKDENVKKFIDSMDKGLRKIVENDKVTNLEISDLLRILSNHCKDSEWLEKRSGAFDKYCNSKNWLNPYPGLVDWLPVVIDYAEDIPEIHVPEITDINMLDEWTK